MTQITVPFYGDNIEINVTHFQPEVQSLTHLLPEDCFEGSEEEFEFNLVNDEHICPEDYNDFQTAALAAYYKHYED